MLGIYVCVFFLFRQGIRNLGYGVLVFCGCLFLFCGVFGCFVFLFLFFRLVVLVGMWFL
jgi:hypothetical protein